MDFNDVLIDQFDIHGKIYSSFIICKVQYTESGLLDVPTLIIISRHH